MAKKPATSYVIRSVQKALKVLRLFESKNAKLSLMEISDAVELNKSAVFRLLTTLTHEGFLERDPKTGKYSLGVTICVLGSSFFSSMSIRDIALPVMRRLADSSGFVVHLVIKSQDDRLIVIEKIGPSTITFIHNLSSSHGGELPIHCSGIGKVYLAGMSPERARAILESRTLETFTPHTVTNVEVILDSLPQIAKQGYALCINEHETYVNSVGCPLFDYMGDICAGISLGGISEMCNDIGMTNLASQLLAAAADISASLGYRGSYPTLK